MSSNQERRDGFAPVGNFFDPNFIIPSFMDHGFAETRDHPSDQVPEPEREIKVTVVPQEQFTPAVSAPEREVKQLASSEMREDKPESEPEHESTPDLPPSLATIPGEVVKKTSALRPRFRFRPDARKVAEAKPLPAHKPGLLRRTYDGALVVKDSAILAWTEPTDSKIKQLGKRALMATFFCDDSLTIMSFGFTAPVTLTDNIFVAIGLFNFGKKTLSYRKEIRREIERGEY